MEHLHERGFTLVETLVAITILLLVIIGPITVAQRGIQSAYYANEQVTAVFLAQEAIEAVRELRDTNALVVYDRGGDTWSWHSNLENSCKVSLAQMGDDNRGCAFDVVDSAFEACGPAINNDCQLKLSVDQEYNYEAGGADSGFTRRVYIGPETDGGVPVMVEVTWQSAVFSGSPARQVILETWIYNHYERYEAF